MIRQDRTRHQATVSTPAAGALFARKGEAAPVGGRRAPRRVITMRPLVEERDAPIALPMPANTSRPDPIERQAQEAARAVTPIVNPTMGPTMGSTMGPTMSPAIGAAAIHPGSRVRASRGAVGAMAIRGPVRPTASRRRGTPKRTTLRLDEAMRQRLARFSASETLSVQALLTRALQRNLPALSIGQAPVSSPRQSRENSAGPAGRRSVRFDPHLYWRLKTAAANRKRSMQSIMVAALEANLSEIEAGGRTARPPVRLSVVA